MLVCAGLGLVLLASLKPQSPGVSIGLLALAAGIMSVRPEMHSAEKLTWVAILVVFAILEVNAINRTEADNKSARDDQNAAFKGIADGLKASLDNSKQQYETTIGHVDGVLETTQKVSVLAKENLENVTGGNSFAYVYPKNIGGSNNFRLFVHNEGKQILSGVVVTVVRVISGSAVPGENAFAIMQPEQNPISIGTLPPNEGRSISLPQGLMTPIPRPDRTAHYHIWINAQNPGSSENLDFRPSKDGRGYAYSLVVWKPATGKRRRDDVYSENLWIRYVKRRDWTEPN